MPRLAAFNFGARKFGFGSLFSSAAATEATYIEDVFSTYLYTGDGSSQTITNGIDLAGKGGLVWTKSRTTAGYRNSLSDTVSGIGKQLFSDGTNAQQTASNRIDAVYNNGYLLGSDTYYNTTSNTYVSWTFRKQPKFFDVVTYTGNGSNRTISHNLGSVPGCIIVKRTDTTGDWKMYHLGLTSAAYAINLNNNGSPEASEPTVWNSTAPTSTVFSVGTATSVNASGGTYVAYLFAHNAGGFGLSGSDNVISCGTYNGTGGVSATTVNLGFEPQFVFISNRTYGTFNLVYDSMRGIVTGGNDAMLNPSTSFAENGAYGNANLIDLNATGFTITASGYDVSDRAGSTYIYIAIRRGPMKVPTSGTSVFTPTTYTGDSTNPRTISVGFAPDLVINTSRVGTNVSPAHPFFDRLRGDNNSLVPVGTQAENGFFASYVCGFNLAQNSHTVGGAGTNYTGTNFVDYSFRRAPSYFDVVCFRTQSSGATTVTHGLGVAPEFMIVKSRDTASAWYVYSAAIGNVGAGFLNSSGNFQYANGYWDYLSSPAPTATQFTCGTSHPANSNTVAYLFATCAGVSKVGSYTGTGALQTINCGFTGGARFVLIKRTDSTGDWYVWDTARGIVSGNDPYLLLNSAADEVTNTDYIDPVASGFELSSTAPAAINANGGTYIFLAIA